MDNDRKRIEVVQQAIKEKCSSGNIQSLLGKGYYVDLSDVEGVAEFMDGLYPVWRDPCVTGDEIAAIPVTVRNWKTFTRNGVIWEEEDLGPVPTTYDELFDAIRDWDARGILDMGYPLFWKGYDSFEVLAYRIINDYVGLRIREGTPIVFENETLLRPLRGLEELRRILNAHDAKKPLGDPLLPEGFLNSVVHVGDGDPRLNYAESVMPLGLTDAQEPVETAFFTVMIINPNSSRVELAKKYLSYLAQHPSAWAQCMLMQGMPEGVREPGYEDATEKYEQLMSELPERLEAALREFDDVAGQQMEERIRALTYDYLYQWSVRPETAELLYQALPYLTVATSDGYGFLQKNGKEFIDMFVSEQIDSLTLVQRLDERMQMMQSEGIE